MIHDLLAHGGGGGVQDEETEADFIVIGAGTVGLPVCTQLARLEGCRVVCLESGGMSQGEDTHPLNEVVHVGTPYAGAALGRFRCVGGTSTRWGGALIPFQPEDLDPAHWPLRMADLAPYVPQVEALFGLEPGPYDDAAPPAELGPHHVSRLAKWPAFRRRNVFNLVGDEARRLPNLALWLNATVTELRAGGQETSLVQVTACAPDGSRLRVRAPRLIIAAGAIESTRLSLLLDRQSGGAVARCSPSLGRYFTDHLSAAVAEVEPLQAGSLNKLVGFRFGPGGSMRNLRLELAGTSEQRAHLPPSFAHVGFETRRPGGFDALREVFRHVQMRRLPPVRVGFDLLRHAPWLARAVWWRHVHRRLLFPAGARLLAHVVIEQRPEPDNRITLSDTRCDAYGTPLAEIHWRIDDADVQRLQRSADLLEQTWAASGLGRYAKWKRLPPAAVAEALRQSGGVFHPTGSTRMGRSAADGVVDRDLRMFAFPQVQLLSTAVLPTGGGANPTMTLMLLAQRCIDQHVRGERA